MVWGGGDLEETGPPKHCKGSECSGRFELFSYCDGGDLRQVRVCVCVDVCVLGGRGIPESKQILDNEQDSIHAHTNM